MSKNRELMRLRDRCLQELVAMAPNRHEAEEKLAEISALEHAMAVVHPPAEPQKYGGVKRAIDAILDYVDEVGEPVPYDDLVQAVVERGFRFPNPNAGSVVKKSISAYLQGEAGRKKHVIREMRGKLGRYEWPDARYSNP